jgi:hypothetical protein
MKCQVDYFSGIQEDDSRIAIPRAAANRCRTNEELLARLTTITLHPGGTGVSKNRQTRSKWNYGHATGCLINRTELFGARVGRW